MVILGQFSFITTFATLVITARLQKFDSSLEEAALNLGATKLGTVRQITLTFLMPAILSGCQMEAHPYHSAFLDMADQQFDLLGQCARANYIKVLNQIFCDRQINWGRLVMVSDNNTWK